MRNEDIPMQHRANFTALSGTASGTSITIGRTKPTITPEKLKALVAGRLEFPAIKIILGGLGFDMPNNLQATAAPVRFGQQIAPRPDTEKIDAVDLDDALAEVGGLSPESRIRLKQALAAQGVLS
jgi:hypothetical protein